MPNLEIMIFFFQDSLNYMKLQARPTAMSAMKNFLSSVTVNL